MQEITTAVGRLVSGHPMVTHPVIDDTTKQPKLQKDGVTPRVECYVGVAIPKAPGETDWKQTPWGQQIVQAAMEGWPNGEWQAPTFAWKITDGDSAAPNKAGNKPCDKEGYQGHWIINASQGWPVACYHVGRYEPHQAIQNKEEIKCGDYVRLQVNAVGNSPSPSPGVYLNPAMMELSRAGIQIISDNAPNATEKFGASAPVVPANALVDTAVAAPATAAAAAPKPPAATAPKPPAAATAPAAAQMTALANGASYVACIAEGWTDETLIAQGLMTAGVTPATDFLTP